MRRQSHTKGWEEWHWGLTRQFAGIKLLSKCFTEMVAIMREEVVAIARPFLHKSLDDLIYLRACTVGLSQRDGLSVRVHRIIHWRTAEDSAPALTESEWPFLSVNLSADHFSNLGQKPCNTVRLYPSLQYTVIHLPQNPEPVRKTLSCSSNPWNCYPRIMNIQKHLTMTPATFACTHKFLYKKINPKPNLGNTSSRFQKADTSHRGLLLDEASSCLTK